MTWMRKFDHWLRGPFLMDRPHDFIFNAQQLAQQFTCREVNSSAIIRVREEDFGLSPKAPRSCTATTKELSIECRLF